ncbi:MAG: sensor histidine kinase [Burkholderiaceae bacterium]|nr:MAG: sensor histidine kinase [Burkholderiaceae bacterium]
MMNTLRRWWSAPWVPPQYGKAPFFWMLSFCIFGWRYIYVPPTDLELLLVALSILGFIPIYIYSFWTNGWRVAVCIVITTAIGIAWAPYNFGGSSFVIFAATMSSRFQEKRHAFLSLFLVLASTAVLSYLLKLQTYFWVPAVIFSIPSALGAIIGERLQRANAKLFRKQEEIEHLASIAERERIARDLHDLLGHTLSVITLKAELARKLHDRDGEACKKEIADIEQTARQALAEVRQAVLGYRDQGLAHELCGAQNALESADVVFESSVEVEALPPAIENIVALALREAVTNIIRHSDAKHCRFRLYQKRDRVHVEIADDGSLGSDKEDAIKRGNGLNGMSERIRSLDGELQIECKQGLTLRFSLPLHGQEAA